jgi:hypothetical protein
VEWSYDLLSRCYTLITDRWGHQPHLVKHRMATQLGFALPSLSAEDFVRFPSYEEVRFRVLGYL